MKVFSTGQVAKICKVHPRTVSRWFDSFRLRGYRIPGSRDRRIPREYLIQFMKENGMPLGDLEDETLAKVLIISQDEVLIRDLKREMKPEESFKIAVVAGSLEAGIMAESFLPDCVVVDFSIGKIEAAKICENFRKSPEHSGVFVIALLPAGGSLALLDCSIKEAFLKPLLNVRLLTERIRTLVGEKKDLP